MGRYDEVIRLRLAGFSDTEISHMLGITEKQVRRIASKIMLTAGEVAYLLGVGANTVRRWSNGGILKSYRISPRGDRRFRREDIDRYLKERHTGEERS